MQENNHKLTVGISPKPEILNPQCSCTECDSVTCFAKRRTAEPCACGVCKNSKSCLYYDSNMNGVSKSDLLFKDIEKELAAGNRTGEFVKKEITYEFDQDNHMKIITKKQSTLFYKALDSINKIEDQNDRSSVRLNSAAPDTRDKPSTAKLSAQVMDVPYKDFQKSISKPQFPPNIPNISPYDIFSRIKEAYKACSCKFCECIAGKSLQNDVCRCKPCECNDCSSFGRQVKSFADYEKLVPKDDEGCPCIRCDRGSCKGIGKGKTKDANECDCVGLLQCNYFKSDSFSQACNCEPCQCIECEPRSIHRHRALIVAPVGEDYSGRNACQCSPCECFECGRGFRLSPNLQNERSTSMNRHPHCHCEMCVNEACIPDGNQSCRCERQNKVMSKPFQKDSHDYDIRRTVVTYNDAHKRKELHNCDTIAMFAAIPNSYPKTETKIKQCDCDQCECLVCKYKESMQNICSSKVFEPIRNDSVKNRAVDCKCSPCECSICDKHDAEPPYTKRANVCDCDVCDCMICDGLASSNIESDKHKTKIPKGTFSAKGDCDCSTCECAECEKLMASCVGDICLCSNCRCENCIKETYSDEVVYPVKRGERLTPSLFRKKIKDAFIESCISTLEENEQILKQPVTKPLMKKPNAFSAFQKTNTWNNNSDADPKCFPESYSNHQMASHQYNTRTETVKHAHISNCGNVKNMHGKNIEVPSESNHSANSSMSFLIDSGSITPSRYRLKSWESSCNSSGHDYPSYLIHFPKSTVETCLNDVMQFDTKNNVNLARITLNSKNNARKQQNMNINIRKPPKIGLAMRPVFSQEHPTDFVNNLTQSNKDNAFNYSAQNFEDYPYRSQKREATHINVNTPKAATVNDNYSKPYFDKHSPGSKKSNNFVLDEDYERVQNTLQEARAFSMQLVGLLEKYEKANREFVSISEKIKNSNVSLSNKTNIPKHYNTEEDLIHTFDIDQVPTKDQHKSSSGSSTEELVTINKNAVQTDEIQLLKSLVDDHSENMTISEICSETNEGRDESGDDINKTNEVLNTITEEREPVEVSHRQDKKRRVATKLHRRYSKMYRRSTICSKRIKSSTSSSVEAVANIAVEKNNIPTPEINKPIEQRENRLFEETKSINKSIKEGDFIDVKSPKLAEHVNMQKQVKKSTTQLSVSVTEKYTKSHHVFQKDVVMIKQPMIEQIRHVVEMKGEEMLPISKKNFCLGTNMNTHGHKFPIMAPLEQEVKAVAQTISKQPTSENATYLYENKALIELHSEVKKLLDMPILQTFESKVSGQKAFLYNSLSKTSSSQTNQESDYHNHNTLKNANVPATSSRNSCESMKVNFLNVRRVSDHTVLVKWNTPRVLNNVEGYELLVDGRAVQKILSPSRRMAVVTCLPHTDKVLLTVRTVLSSPCPDHYPAATVIYQPKIR